jgi:hypothetical protein
MAGQGPKEPDKSVKAQAPRTASVAIRAPHRSGSPAHGHIADGADPKYRLKPRTPLASGV